MQYSVVADFFKKEVVWPKLLSTILLLTIACAYVYMCMLTSPNIATTYLVIFSVFKEATKKFSYYKKSIKSLFYCQRNEK